MPREALDLGPEGGTHGQPGTPLDPHGGREARDGGREAGPEAGGLRVVSPEAGRLGPEPRGLAQVPEAGRRPGMEAQHGSQPSPHFSDANLEPGPSPFLPGVGPMGGGMGPNFNKANS